MSFVDEIKTWIDPDGLIGTERSPGKWTTGNGILETAFAVLYLTDLPESTDRDLIRGLIEAVLRCQTSEGSFNKNPGRTDQITHDDLMGAASLSRIVSSPLSSPLAGLLVRLGEQNMWNIGNSLPPYWDAHARPWDVCYYRMCAGRKSAWYEEVMMVLEILIAALRLAMGKTSPSGDRLRWLRLRAVKGFSVWTDLAGWLWRLAARRAYVTPGTMMKWYYDNAEHPYAVWGNQLRF